MAYDALAADGLDQLDDHPFTTDRALDEASLSRAARWQVDQGSHGLSIGDSTGEPATWSPAERGRAMAAVPRSVAERVPFLVETGAASLGDTLDLTSKAGIAVPTRCRR